MANFKNFNFKQQPRLVINGTEYDFETIISGEFHIFNKSQMKFSKVWYKDGRDRMLNSIKFPSFSIVELYYGNDLAFFGVKKKQEGIDLNPFKPKHVDITVIDFKEWLTHKPMDFVINKKKPEWVVNEIVKKLAEKRIKVGQLQFTINNDIRAYNTKDKTAYDVLRMIERKTQSILQILPNSQGEMEINFFTRDSARVNKSGVQLDLQDPAKMIAFYQLYQVTKFQAKEDVVKYANQIRVESEKALYETPTNVEIDLTTSSETYSLNLPIGTFDKGSAELINADGTKARNLIVITKDEASKGKSYDISYSVNDKTVNINSKLIGQTQRIKFSFYGIGRISYQFDDIKEQQRIASISDTNGILHKYEKHNDETTPSDMIALGKGYLEKNNTPRLILEIASKLPIWDLGEHTILKNYVTPTIDGEYIVFKMKLRQILNNDGEILTTYEYELLNTLDFEERINKEDPQRYRDNPIFDAKDISYTTRQDIQEELFLIFENFSCQVLDENGNPITKGGA